MMIENIEQWAELHPIIVSALTMGLNIIVTLFVTCLKQKNNRKILKQDLEKHKNELLMKYVIDRNISRLSDSLDVLADYIALVQQISNNKVSGKDAKNKTIFTHLKDDIVIQLNLDLAKLKLRFDSTKDEEKVLIFLIQIICDNISKKEQAEDVEDRFRPMLHLLTMKTLTDTAQIYYSIKKERIASDLGQSGRSKRHLHELEEAFYSEIDNYLQKMEENKLGDYVKQLKASVNPRVPGSVEN